VLSYTADITLLQSKNNPKSRMC